MGDTVGAWADAQPGEGPLVLVIDDDPHSLVICDRTLQAAGYRTVTAASGAEGLARLDRLAPALVVLDLAMPGMDGFAVARAIRARSGGDTLPILIFTGLSRASESGSRQAGGSAFCTKPIEPQRLVAEVRRLCPVG